MKTFPIALAPQYTGAGSTLCQCLVMRLRDGTSVYAASIDRNLPIGGFVYLPWLEVSDLVSTASLGVDNLELTVITDDTVLMRDLEVGRYDNAAFHLFETNYLNTADGIVSSKQGTTGEAKIADSGRYTLEFRGLTQALQQTVGIVTSRTCRANFADYPKRRLASRCGLLASAFTTTGEATAVSSRQVFSDVGHGGEVTDWFGEGFVKFTTGLNAGFERQVKTHTLYVSGLSTGRVFGFVLPFPFDISVGDQYTAIAGCRKRLMEDCKAKFSNVLNFQGEPHLPGVDALTKVPGVGT